jgi:hemerythrin-like domain-containing protein
MTHPVTYREHATPGTLRRALSEDHRTLEASFKKLLDQAHRDDREGIASAFTAMEAGLKTHLEMEEREILPLFAQMHADDAVRIREEHGYIRRRLEDLGIAIELHALRADMVEDFATLLRAHAAHEDKVMYEWSESALPSGEKRALLHWILARLEERLVASPWAS